MKKKRIKKRNLLHLRSDHQSPATPSIFAVFTSEYPFAICLVRRVSRLREKKKKKKKKREREREGQRQRWYFGRHLLTQKKNCCLPRIFHRLALFTLCFVPSGTDYPEFRSWVSREIRRDWRCARVRGSRFANSTRCARVFWDWNFSNLYRYLLIQNCIIHIRHSDRRKLNSRSCRELQIHLDILRELLTFRLSK